MITTKEAKKILTKKEPEKSLLVPLKKKAGRNNQGRITVRHRGGGAKRMYRIIEFGEKDYPFTAQVKALEYDPNRNCFIALIEYNGKKRYILAPQGLNVGDSVVYDETVPLKPGNRMRLKNIPVGTFVFNIELFPGQGGKMARSAGSACQVLAHEQKYANLKMPSGEVKKVLSDCFASIGSPSNAQYRFEKLGKAGRKRHLGIRPTVRGSAMSPAAHPHGGGEGKAPIGMPHPKTPWGKPALGVKTRRRKWTDKLIVQRRKKKKK